MENYLFTGARDRTVLSPHGAAMDFKGVDAVSEYRVDVPPCPSPQIQAQDFSMDINSGTASWPMSDNVQKSVPQVDDETQASYCCVYSFERSRMLTLHARLMEQLYVE